MNKKEQKKLIKTIEIITLLLIAAIVLLALIEYLPGLDSLTKEPEKYLIEDECGMIAGNLIHQIKNDGDCRIECRNECEIRNKKFYESEFITRENACFICNCYCK